MHILESRLLRRTARGAATAITIVAAAVAGLVIWRSYILAPWTRDGRTRVQVAMVAPQISGRITQLRVADNQVVHKGDVLYVIEPFDFQMALATAKATLDMRATDLLTKQQNAQRRQSLTTLSTSVEEKQQFVGNAAQAQAAYDGAGAELAQAEINLARTEVRSPVNGFVTNMLLRVGDYAHEGAANLSVVDIDSFWIDGYFEETKMPFVCVGDATEARLMGYRRPIRGVVESITRGISVSDAAPSTQGLPNVDAVYTWVRLAQRIPVRIKITEVPQGIPLIAGMTATVSLDDARYQSEGVWEWVWHTLRSGAAVVSPAAAACPPAATEPDDRTVPLSRPLMVPAPRVVQAAPELAR